MAVAVNPALTYLRVRHRNEVYYLAKGTFTSRNALKRSSEGRNGSEGVPKLKSIEQIFKGKRRLRSLGRVIGDGDAWDGHMMDPSMSSRHKVVREVSQRELPMWR